MPRDRDRYGRLVATCRVGRLDLGARLVAEGLARAYTRFGDDYAANERKAKTEAIGLWHGPAAAPWEFRADRAPAAAPPPAGRWTARSRATSPPRAPASTTCPAAAPTSAPASTRAAARPGSATRPRRGRRLPPGPPVAQPFFSTRRPSSSAICTAFSAAPLRRLSETTHSDSPLSIVESCRIRLT